MRGVRETVAIATGVTVLATAGVGAAAEDGRGPSAIAAGRAHYEAAIIRCINYQRRRVGRMNLFTAYRARGAARMHSQNMARGGFFSHTDGHGRGPRERVEMSEPRRWVAVGENIAAGYGSARRTCRGWMTSPGHRRNMLSRLWSHVACGVAYGGYYGDYVTCDFLTEEW